MDQEIHVHIGDSLSFVCPHKAINIGNQASLVQTDNLYENMYLLQPNQENDYNNCDSTGKKIYPPNNFHFKFHYKDRLMKALMIIIIS